MTYLIKRGKRALRFQARAHLAKRDREGEIAGSFCGAAYDISSNVPWGLKTCRHCARRSRT